MPDTLGSLSADAKAFYDRNLLFRASQVQVMYNAGQKRSIPANSGNQISYRRFNTLSLATTALTEGVTPSASSLSVTEITGTVAHYGNYVEVSDLLDMLGIDPVIQEATDVLGQNAGESIEAVIRTELVTGTSVLYATGSARGSQSASNPITLSLIRKAVRTLDANNTQRFHGNGRENGVIGAGTYLGIIHPNAVYDLQNDSEIKNALQYSSPEKLWTGEVMSLYNVRLLQTTLAPVFTGAGSGGVDVYGTIIVGQNAFGVVDVAATGKFETIVKPRGSSGTLDPLNQRATIAWKGLQLPKILNNNFMTRIEAGVSS